MTDHGLGAFVEAMLTDRAPAEFRADTDCAEVLRAAIAIRSSRFEFVGPDPQFVENLHRQLAADTNHGGLLPFPPSGQGERQVVAGRRPSRSRRRPRRRFGALAKAAVAALLVAGTFGASQLAGGHGPAPVVRPAAGVGIVRSGLLVAADGRPLGRAYAYSGNPSWVFMDLRGSDLTGHCSCLLHLGDGSTVPVGVVPVYHGAGDWARTVTVTGIQLRTATLATSTGVSVASATFS